VHTESRTVRAGDLLVATPELTDPNFAGTVVLMLDVDADGSLGVVLNRPSSLDVGEILQPWGSLVAGPAVCFEGGPVGRDGALAVALARDLDAAPIGFRPVNGRLGLLDLDTPVELVEGSLEALRVFVGYAGWGAEQLEGEIEVGAWYTVGSQATDVFRGNTATLWRDVLRRQPGELAWHSTRTAHPELN
jgi:putative transcriptional regulator